MNAAIIISCLLAVAQPSLPDSVEISKRTYPIRDLQWGEATIEEFTVRNNSSTRVATWIDYETYSSDKKRVPLYFFGIFGEINYVDLMIEAVKPLEYYTSYYVGGFFLKLIDPGSSFKYIVYLIEPIFYKHISSMDHIFVYKEEEVSEVLGFRGNPLPSDIEEQLYHEPYLIILNPTNHYRDISLDRVPSPRPFGQRYRRYHRGKKR